MISINDNLVLLEKAKKNFEQTLVEAVAFFDSQTPETQKFINKFYGVKWKQNFSLPENIEFYDYCLMNEELVNFDCFHALKLKIKSHEIQLSGRELWQDQMAECRKQMLMSHISSQQFKREYEIFYKETKLIVEQASEKTRNLIFKFFSGENRCSDHSFPDWFESGEKSKECDLVTRHDCLPYKSEKIEAIKELASISATNNILDDFITRYELLVNLKSMLDYGTSFCSPLKMYKNSQEHGKFARETKHYGTIEGCNFIPKEMKAPFSFALTPDASEFAISIRFLATPALPIPLETNK